MSKCMWCDNEYRQDRAKVGFDNFVHCPICGMPLFDISIQDTDHWIWLYMSEKEKNKYGYYDKLEKEENN